MSHKPLDYHQLTAVQNRCITIQDGRETKKEIVWLGGRGWAGSVKTRAHGAWTKTIIQHAGVPTSPTMDPICVTHISLLPPAPTPLSPIQTSTTAVCLADILG